MSINKGKGMFLTLWGYHNRSMEVLKSRSMIKGLTKVPRYPITESLYIRSNPRRNFAEFLTPAFLTRSPLRVSSRAVTNVPESKVLIC